MAGMGRYEEPTPCYYCKNCHTWLDENITEDKKCPHCGSANIDNANEDDGK